MTKTTNQLEDESTAAHEAHDAAIARLEAVKEVRRILSELDEAMRGEFLSPDDKAALASVHTAGPWIELGRTVKALDAEVRKLEGVAHDAQQAFIASWEAA